MKVELDDQELGLVKLGLDAILQEIQDSPGEVLEEELALEQDTLDLLTRLQQEYYDEKSIHTA